MRLWLAFVSVQLVTKSYAYEHKCRVQATSPAAAVSKATRVGLAALRPCIKGRRVQAVHVDLTNLGPVERPAPVHEEARV